MTDTTLGLLAATGALRAAINLGNGALVQEVDGALRGVSPALAQRLADGLGVPLDAVRYNGARKVFEDAERGLWDICFLAIDPARAGDVAFTRPYVVIEATYAVRSESPLTEVAQADRPGTRILVGRGSAYDLHLTQALKHAELVRADTPGASFEAFRSGEADIVAGVRQSLEAHFGGDTAYRILPGRCGAIEQAMAVPRRLEAALPALDAFVADAIADGFVRRALDESGKTELQVPSA